MNLLKLKKKCRGTLLKSNDKTGYISNYCSEGRRNNFDVRLLSRKVKKSSPVLTLKMLETKKKIDVENIR